MDRVEWPSTARPTTNQGDPRSHTNKRMQVKLRRDSCIRDGFVVGRVRLLAGLIVLLLAGLTLSLGVGAVWVPPGEVLAALWSRVTGAALASSQARFTS